MAAVVALFVPGAIFPLSFAALGVALWRARVKPAVCGPLLVVAAVLFAAGNIPDVDALLIIGDAMFVVALAPLGLARLRDEWPRRRPSRRHRRPDLAVGDSANR